MVIRLALSIGLLGLSVSCGAPPAPTRPTAPLALLPMAAPATLTPQAIATPLGTTGEALVAQAEPTTAALPHNALQEHLTLAAAKASAVILQELASQAQSGQLDGINELAQLVAAIATAAEQTLAANSPDPALQDAWMQARAALPDVRDILAKLIAKQITSSDVPGLLAPVQPKLDQALQDAEQQLTSTYGIDRAQLQALRDQSLAQLRETLQAAPTPQQ